MKKVYHDFCPRTPDALKELSKMYNERTQVFEDFHIRLHELSSLEALREFTDLHKSWLKHKTIRNKTRRTVRKPWFNSRCRQEKA